MTNLYTQAQVAILARGAGLTLAASKIAAAIAMCEGMSIIKGVQYSDFDLVGDQKLADETWGYSYGGWQVRSLRDQKGTGGLRDEDQLPNPEFNAKAMYAIYKGAGYSWRAWSTYNSGAYLGFMGDDPAAAVPAGSYRVTGGDSLSKIGTKTGYDWHQIATVNRIVSPYTIYPGKVLLLPDFPHVVAPRETLTTIASKYGSNLTAAHLAEYNGLAVDAVLELGSTLKVPRL